MKKFIKNAVVLTTAVMLALGLSTTAFASGIGNVTTLSDSEIASKVQYTTMKAVSGSKTRNINQISFSSKDSDYMLLPYFGDNLLSRHTLTEMAENAEKDGYEVVGGVNGDFFYVEGDKPTGMPRGPIIQNDRIICTEDFPPNINAMSAEDWQTIGFKRDGTAVTGHFTTERTITMQQDDGSTTVTPLTVMNRTMLEMGLQLYTSDYGSTVGNETPAYAVVLTATQGKFALGETTVCKVESINKSQKNIPLKKDKIVLCTPVNYLNDEDMANISSIFVGQRIDFTIKPQDTAWSDVFEAISGPNSIVSANTVTDKTAAIPENYPSSIIGVTADGGYIMTQIDGRNMGGSFGIGPIEAGGYMKSLGCTDSLLFDGGGSSEMVIKSDGKFVVCNKPSDGTERKVGTCLLIVKKTDVYSTPYKAAAAPAYEASFMHKFFPYLAAAVIIIPIALIAVIVVLIIKHKGKKKAEKAVVENNPDKADIKDKADNTDNTDSKE